MSELHALTAERDALEELTDRQVARTGKLTGQVDSLLKERNELKAQVIKVMADAALEADGYIVQIGALTADYADIQRRHIDLHKKHDALIARHPEDTE